MFITTSLPMEGMYLTDEPSGQLTPSWPKKFFQSEVPSDEPGARAKGSPASPEPPPPVPPIVLTCWSIDGRTLYMRCRSVLSALFLGMMRTMLPWMRYLRFARSITVSSVWSSVT